MAFAADGTLWVTANFGAAVEGFTPAQLAASGSPTPAITIGSDGSSLAGPCGAAFDAAGNLWVANLSISTVVKYTPAQLAASGTPTPDVTLGSDGTSLNGPLSLAFDNSGNLWVNNTNSELVEKFTPAQLAASGTPTPDVTITPALPADAGGLTFSPPPAGLPIHTP